MFIATIYNSQVLETAQVLVYLYNGILLGHKKKELFCNSIDRLVDYYAR